MTNIYVIVHLKATFPKNFNKILRHLNFS